MFSLLKRDFYLSRTYLVFMLFFPPIIYILNMPIIYIYTFALTFLIFNTFYYDYKNKINFTMISLPVRKVHIVGARYLFLSMVIFLFLLYHWLIDYVAHHQLPYLDSNPLNGITVFIIFIGISLAVAISLPIYYIFQSFIKASFVQIIILFIGSFSFAIVIGNPFIDVSRFIILILDIVSIQPFIMLMLFSITVLFLSCHISTWLFTKKDVS